MADEVLPDKGINLWDIKKKYWLWQTPTRYSLHEFSYTPDGKYLAVSAVESDKEKPKIQFFDAATGKLAYQLDVTGQDLVFSADGKYLALTTSVSNDKGKKTTRYLIYSAPDGSPIFKQPAKIR